jgi:hypothetical protein
MARLAPLLLATVAIWPMAAVANDSSAEIGIGGLTLKHSASVRLDSEELTISRARVSVSYRFTNTSNKDVETLVAFPLPDQDFDIEVPVVDFAKQLDFHTSVDGVSVPLEVLVTAEFGGKDISARLDSLGLPRIPVPDLFDGVVNSMSDVARKALLSEGLIVEDGNDGKQLLWTAKWKLHTAVTRTQVFPAGRTVRVDHSYVPYVGGSVGGLLEKQYRDEPDYVSRKKRWCIDGDFLSTFDRRMAEGKKAEQGFRYSEVWIGYVLKSGANWAGPIRDFRLVIDKGDPKSLVSFCGEGVKKLDATRFEIRRKNFTPKSDLDVLLVDFHKE